jgi:molybdopterin/thiamine biosynthesis adenylyltransferase
MSDKIKIAIKILCFIVKIRVFEMKMDLEKYSRNILLDEIDIEGQGGICKASIVVLGCGGLASFVLPILVSCGVKSLVIIDFDTVSLSNLPRQIMFQEADIGKKKVEIAKSFLQKLNQNCEIIAVNGNHELLETFKCDAIVDLTDSAASRYHSNFVSIGQKKPFFTGSAIGFEGHVYSFANHKFAFPCYECVFPRTEEVLKQEQSCANMGVFPPIVEIIGGFIASNILKYFAKMEVDFHEFLYFNLIKGNRKIRINQDKKCQCNAQ